MGREEITAEAAVARLRGMPGDTELDILSKLRIVESVLQEQCVGAGESLTVDQAVGLVAILRDACSQLHEQAAEAEYLATVLEQGGRS